PTVHDRLERRARLGRRQTSPVHHLHEDVLQPVLHRPHPPRVRRRKFLRSALPSRVSTDSGWNCTPSVGWRLWRSPMMTPSSVLAETSSSAGTLPGSTTSEW